MKSIVSLFFSLFLFTTSFAVESDKIFKIFTNDGQKEYCATAFFISETRVLTAHTFNHHTDRHFLMINGKLITARLVKIDKHADIAVLESEQKNATFFILSDTLPSKGEQVNALGFMHEDRFLTDLPEMVKSAKDDDIKCTPDGVNGMSGCPLVDSSGKVVGMLVRGYGSNSHSIPSHTLKAFVDR